MDSPVSSTRQISSYLSYLSPEIWGAERGVGYGEMYMSLGKDCSHGMLKLNLHFYRSHRAVLRLLEIKR